ncbi:MAG: hypothetical protein A2283_13080 [Lentisphaerae bacterium RIFOXYA12_FULL_48_11]|nr:MAG: hypothetical protein A2283_13080 [Lentisphaerae bacterium RIFOXYA12_FULL_48_11]
MGKTMFVGSSGNDSVFGLDTDTGAEKWRFYTEGPVRLAPAAWDNKVYFVSDDGHLYCLDAATGALLWKVRGSPSARKVMGNGRLISVWPARGGPVIADGRVYFTAGIWPFEGIFIYALDAQTGKTVWINDSSGCLYAEHPHNAMSFGGPSPQGYLLINNGRLVVPNSRAFPAFYDLANGKLLHLEFGHGGGGSRPGGWFLAGGSDGKLCVDPGINTEIHDGGPHTIGQIGNSRKGREPLQKTITIGNETYNVQEGISRLIRVGGKDFVFTNGFAGVEGEVHTMLAADGKLFIVTRSGRIYCFGGKSVGAKRYAIGHRPLQYRSDAWTAKAGTILRLSGQIEGYTLIPGLGNGRLAEELINQSKLHAVVTDPDEGKIKKFRSQFAVAGLYGSRIAFLSGEVQGLGLPPYYANLIVCENPESVGEKWLSCMFQSLRPYGGVMCLECSASQHRDIERLLKQPAFAGSKARREKEFTIIMRDGALPGSANYTGEANYDQLVRMPLGVLWFGDTFHHHKLFFKGYEHDGGRGRPTHIRVVDGTLSYFATKEPQEASPASLKYMEWVRQYSLKEFDEARIDVYTGRTLPSVAASPVEVATVTPSHGVVSLTRRNPITGIEEAREFIKTYGCDTLGADYGNMITMRSGTASFYDKLLESGTVNISGTRSGCRNSIVPACGVLNIPSWTGNCTCNYPVFTSLGLVSMPPEYEQWSVWGGVAVNAPLRRVGINLGAPGDRMASDGTLWLDWPSVGGPSPEVKVKVMPEKSESFYRHSLWMHGGNGWPWVFASGIEGVRSIQIDTVTRATNAVGSDFSVRWIGSVEPQFSEEYSFHVLSDGPMRFWLKNRPLVDNTVKLRKDGRREASARIALNAGTRYDIIVEYTHTNNPASATPALAELSWSSKSVPRTVIPPERLFTPDGREGGLAGIYYRWSRLFGQYVNLKESIPALLQIDPQIRFEWGKTMPEPIARQYAQARPVNQCYTVRLVFAEPTEIEKGKRVFSVKLQGREVLHDFDIIKEAGGYNRGIIREFKGIAAEETMNLEFVPATDMLPLICGIELIAEKP